MEAAVSDEEEEEGVGEKNQRDFKCFTASSFVLFPGFSRLNFREGCNNPAERRRRRFRTPRLSLRTIFTVMCERSEVRFLEISGFWRKDKDGRRRSC